ncbi:hypothetical protein K7X08_021480 [Anisodus acutangulus]|uniref:Uncharacterized protein n=1 Tax=Anisodus acutangulus TaxID=402998 RepID=A0A9Q1M5I2_9SOLA|nr:hypothetical protein K7X08_021480 [Anisodus acutangulus]
MNCLQNIPRSSGLPLRSFTGTSRNPYAAVVSLVVSGPESSTEKDETEKDEGKSDTYSNDMTAAMGAG